MDSPGGGGGYAILVLIDPAACIHVDLPLDGGVGVFPRAAMGSSGPEPAAVDARSGQITGFVYGDTTSNGQFNGRDRVRPEGVVVRGNWEPPAATTATPGGRFTLNDVPAGDLTLTVEWATESMSRTVRMTPGGFAHVDFVFAAVPR